MAASWRSRRGPPSPPGPRPQRPSARGSTPSSRLVPRPRIPSAWWTTSSWPSLQISLEASLSPLRDPVGRTHPMGCARLGHPAHKEAGMGNPVVYFDVTSPQGDELKRFYSQLFGWRLTEASGGYALIDTRAGEGINGGIGTATADHATPVAFYVQAADLQAVLDRAEKLGGRTLIPVTDVPNIVTYAMFADPDGLVIGLVKEPYGTGEHHPSKGNGIPVDWFEVLGSNGERTQSFYTDLFGWKLDPTSPADYAMVDTDAG